MDGPKLGSWFICLQILEGGDPAEVERVAQLLDYVDAELLGNCNFEFLQVTGPPCLHPEYALYAWLGVSSDSSASVYAYCFQNTNCSQIAPGGCRDIHARTLVRTSLQAFLRVVLQIHGEAVMEHEELRRRASQIEQHLRESWNRIEALVEQTRCMVGLLSNQQV